MPRGISTTHAACNIHAGYSCTPDSCYSSPGAVYKQINYKVNVKCLPLMDNKV